jgi:hypothetical protein
MTTSAFPSFVELINRLRVIDISSFFLLEKGINELICTFTNVKYKKFRKFKLDRVF